MPRIAVDTVRAGTPAPEVVRAASSVLATDPDLRLLLVGPLDPLRAALEGSGAAVPADRIQLVDAPRAVGPGDDPVVAVRGRRDASVRVAVDLVAGGEADAVVSAGPPAATIVAARFGLRRLPGLRLPGLAVELPLEDATVTVLDAGAETDATAGTLVRYGELGADLACRRGTAAPRVAALAPLGTSSRAVREVVALFDAADLGAGRFVGACGPAEALAGDVDVLVTGGAAGAILVDTVRALRPRGTSHALVVGIEGTVATLPPSDVDGVAAALADVAALVRARWAPSGAPRPAVAP